MRYGVISSSPTCTSTQINIMGFFKSVKRAVKKVTKPVAKVLDKVIPNESPNTCLLYTSDAADE